MNYQKLTNHETDVFQYSGFGHVLWEFPVAQWPQWKICCLWLASFNFLNLCWNQLYPPLLFFFFLRDFFFFQVWIMVLISTTTHKQQGAHQHLIYVHAWEQHCVSLIYYLIIRVLVMIFSLSRKVLHICSLLWIDIQSSLLKYLVSTAVIWKLS